MNLLGHKLACPTCGTSIVWWRSGNEVGWVCLCNGPATPAGLRSKYMEQAEHEGRFPRFAA